MQSKKVNNEKIHLFQFVKIRVIRGQNIFSSSTNLIKLSLTEHCVEQKKIQLFQFVKIREIRGQNAKQKINITKKSAYFNS